MVKRPLGSPQEPGSPSLSSSTPSPEKFIEFGIYYHFLTKARKRKVCVCFAQLFPKQCVTEDTSLKQIWLNQDRELGVKIGEREFKPLEGLVFLVVTRYFNFLVV